MFDPLSVHEGENSYVFSKTKHSRLAARLCSKPKKYICPESPETPQ